MMALDDDFEANQKSMNTFDFPIIEQKFQTPGAQVVEIRSAGEPSDVNREKSGLEIPSWLLDST